MSSGITKSSLATDDLFNFNSRKKLKRKRRRNKSKNTNLRKKKLKKFYYQKRAGSTKSNTSKLESEFNSKLSVMSNWYWSNYKKAVQWQEKHRVAHWKSCALALFEENRYLLQIINQLRPDLYSQISDPCKKLNARFCSNQSYQFPSQLNKSRNLNDYLNVNDRAGVRNYYYNDDDDDDDDDDEEIEEEEEEEEEEEQENDGNNGISNNSDDDLEFEMSEEMVEFFKQSYKHKMELKKLKEKELLSKAEDEIQQLQTNKIKRAEEMKLLYGEGASMIIGMETAVQLSFEKYCDIKSPKYWPNIPFRL